MGDSENRASPVFSGLHAIIWMSLSFFWMVLAAMLLVSIRREALEDLVSLGGLSAATFLSTAALLIARYPGGSRLGTALGFRPTHPLLVPLALLGGISAQVPAEGILSIIHRIHPQSQEEALARLQQMTPHGLAHGVALVLVLSILVPLAEEVFFRGAVFGALRRSGRSGARAALYTGLGFTLCHFDLAMLLPIGLVAAYLGIVRATSGSLWPCVMAHVGFNGVTMMLAVTRTEISEEWFLSPEVQVLGAGAFFAICWLGFVLARQSPAARASRKAEESVA